MAAHGIEQHLELVAFLLGVQQFHDRHQATDVVATTPLLGHALHRQAIGVLVHRAGHRPRPQCQFALAGGPWQVFA
ncbi:hypothetical protein D3C80_1410720 [compost metagenome]